MSGKRYVKMTISFTLFLLLLIVMVQVVVDPLLQYHKPWLGMKAVITNERYQDAGVAKHYDYDNVLIGNSLSENFYVSDINKMFGGQSVKLTMEGSHALDWTYVLDIVKKKHPKYILMNLDTGILSADPNKMKHELPEYLYDNIWFNDLNYLLNFEILNKFTIETLYANKSGRIPDYNKVFIWNENRKTSRADALKHYKRPPKSNASHNSEVFLMNATANMELLSKYYIECPDTQFVFFCSPFSILSWDRENQGNNLKVWRKVYLKLFGDLIKEKNVSVYFWIDKKMLDTICNLDNYVDEMHYNISVCKMMTTRISKKEGLLNNKNYKDRINRFFDFLDTYDYDSIFQ